MSEEELDAHISLDTHLTFSPAEVELSQWVPPGHHHSGGLFSLTQRVDNAQHPRTAYLERNKTETNTNKRRKLRAGVRQEF